MKHTRFYSLFVVCAIFFCACNQEEGLGGSSSIEGYVYDVIHYDDNLSFRTDTFPAAKTDVYLIFGNNSLSYFGKDVEADMNGLFRFDYLREGNYIAYSYSSLPDGRKEAVSTSVTVGKGNNKADTLFVHSGKAYGTAIIVGKVHTTYHHNGGYRGDGPGTGIRAYIRHAGESVYFDDARSSNGTFFFQKLLPGTYEIAVETEHEDTEVVSLVIQTITITETEKVYEIPKVFEVNTSV